MNVQLAEEYRKSVGGNILNTKDDYSDSYVLWLERKVSILKEIQTDLDMIQSFGYKNPGCGYSCASKLEGVLKKLNSVI